MKLKIYGQTTSKTAKVFIEDTSLSTGIGLSGLVFNSTGLSGYYIREGDATPTQITLATASVGTWSTGGFVEVDRVKMRGVYEFGIPNAAISGTTQSHIMLHGAANMAPCLLEIELDAVNYQDPYRFGLQTLPMGITNTSSGVTTPAMAASGVWTASPSTYSGIDQFGGQLQPIYYADVKQYRDRTNGRDEYSVIWYRNQTILSSGEITGPALSVRSTADGSLILSNKAMFAGTYAGNTFRWNETSTILSSGEPYQAIVSGTIDGSVRTWRKIIGRHDSI